LKAFSEHLDVLKENMINSAPATLENMQGRAQSVSALLKMFESCKDTAEKITTARKANQ
jgi:hypothetical protein